MGERVCPKCGYVLQPFDTECAKCAHAKADPGTAQPTASPYQQPAWSPAVRPQAPATAADTPKAGFWIRFAAAVVDGIILTIAELAVAAVLAKGAGLTRDHPAIVVANVLIAAGYAIVMIGSRGQTIGMAAVGVMVVKTDGNPPDYAVAVIRYLGTFVSALPCCLGYLWIAFDPNKQAWHDKIANTYVVRA
jgi:uncharacterized RDD family membrane protein YckC